MNGLAFDVSHMLAGGLVLGGFMLLYQTRLYALLNVYAAQAIVLSAAVAWQALVQGAPHLYVTAAIALAVQGGADPLRAAPRDPRTRAPRATSRMSSASARPCWRASPASRSPSW